MAQFQLFVIIFYANRVYLRDLLRVNSQIIDDKRVLFVCLYVRFQNVRNGCLRAANCLLKPTER